MKTLYYLLLILTFSIFMIGHSYTQCIPDGVGCIDIDEPGQICPDTLNEAYVGTYYEETITIWPPSEATIVDAKLVIYKIEIDSIGNIPPGINYEINSTDLYPDTAYCLSITGTPTTAGTYPLYIRVIPYIIFNETVIELPPQVNDTSVVVNINQATGLSIIRNNSFEIIECSPNPFKEQTKIGFYNSLPEVVRLQIYSQYGKMLYSENLNSSTGANYFTFNGRNLECGIYMYKISITEKSYSGKFIKID